MPTITPIAQIALCMVNLSFSSSLLGIAIEILCGTDFLKAWSKSSEDVECKCSSYGGSMFEMESIIHNRGQ